MTQSLYDNRRQLAADPNQSGEWEREKCLLFDCSKKQALITEFGSPGRIRTGDLSINSRMLYR